VNAGIGVSWDGPRVTAPPGVVDKNGFMDLEPFMPANFKKAKADVAKAGSSFEFSLHARTDGWIQICHHVGCVAEGDEKLSA